MVVSEIPVFSTFEHLVQANPVIVVGGSVMGTLGLAGVVGFKIWWHVMNEKYKDGGAPSSFSVHSQKSRSPWDLTGAWYRAGRRPLEKS